MPKISVIIPYKNSEKYLNECLSSIQRQTFPDWEIIGINDGSEDKSASIFKEFAQQDPRIQTFTNIGSGIIPALDQAFKLASGIYFTRIDSDDLVPENRLELMLELALVNTKRTIITGLVRYFGEGDVSEGYRSYEQWLNEININGTQWKNIYRECVIASPNWLTHGDNIVAIGGFRSLTYPEDYDLVLKWYRARMKIATVPEITLQWREHPERTSRNSNHYDQAAFFKLKIEAFLENDLRSKNLILWGKNQKTKLVSGLLKEANISHQTYALKDFRKIESFPGTQLLVGVYPSQSERKQITNYLSGLNMVEGIDWWWL